jgi:hypothetical protein
MASGKIVDGFVYVAEWAIDGQQYSLRQTSTGALFAIADGRFLELKTDEWLQLADAINRMHDSTVARAVSTHSESRLMNAGKPWNSELDAELAEKWNAESSIAEIARHFSRTTGAIASRLVRLGLVESREDARKKTKKT